MPENDLYGGDLAALYEHCLTKGAAPQFIKNFLMKAGGTVSDMAGAINLVYGSLVYDLPNRAATAHAIFKKVPWEISGYRYSTGNPNTKLQGGMDPGTIMSDIDTTPAELSSIPGFVHSAAGLGVDANFRMNHDDGLDGWAWKRANLRDIHAQGLNEELLNSAEAEANAIGAGGSSDAKNAGNGVGIETIDRAFASKLEADQFKVGTGNYDVFETQVNRDAANALFEAQVYKPDATQTAFQTNVPFQVDGLYAVIDATEKRGADPGSQVFLTGYESRRALYKELATMGRFDASGQVQAKISMAGIAPTATHNGRDITFTVKTFEDRIVIADHIVPSNGTTKATPATDVYADGGTGLPHWFLPDMRHAHIKVGFPTMYLEADNPIYLAAWKSRFVYWTCEQFYATKWNVHGKVRSQSA